MVITNELKQLAKAAVSKAQVANYSMENVEYALREELKKLAGTPQLFQRNKYDIFDLIVSVVEDVLPMKVEQIMGQFAEVRQVGQGNKATFTRKLGARRGKTFIGEVSPAGTYEAFRLDEESFEIQVKAYGAAARLDWERYLDGQDNMADLVDIILEGLEEIIYKLVYNQLLASYNSVAKPNANKYTYAGFDAQKMTSMLNVVRAYGQNAVIFCTPQFAAEMSNEITYSTGVASLPEIDRLEIRNQGYIGVFRGSPIVVLPQSFEDETNEKFVFDPSIAFIIPTGKEKIVKIVLEGELQMKADENRDWSMEIQFYKKLGTVVLVQNNWAIYRNTAIEQ